MGYLTMDHRGGQGIDEKSGTLQEFDTVTCGHCTGLVAVLTRPNEKVYFSNVDIAKGTAVAQFLGQEYKGKFTCKKCRKTVCRACAEKCAQDGECNPIMRAVEKMLERRGR